MTKKCRLLRCDFLASFRHPPSGPQVALVLWTFQAFLRMCYIFGFSIMIIMGLNSGFCVCFVEYIGFWKANPSKLASLALV